MARRRDRQAMVMAFTLLGVTGFAVVDRLAAPAEDAVGRAVEPAQRLTRRLGARLDEAARGSRDAAALRQQVDHLLEANADLEMRNLKTGDLANEVAKLRDLLGFAHQRVDLDLKGASVVGRKVASEPGNLLHTIKLDIGTREGIEAGMPVATDRGLVGRVERAAGSWSDVLLITDPRSAVVARVERSRATGMVFGTPTGDLILRYVPQDLEDQPNVQVGDVIFTAGLSARFPPMIPIGQIVEILQRDVATHQEAVIRPSVDFDQLEFVLVVSAFEPTREDSP